MKNEKIVDAFETLGKDTKAEKEVTTKKTEKKVDKKVITKKEKVVVPTVASTVKKIGEKTYKTKLDFVKAIKADLEKAGITENIRGNKLTEDVILSQVNAIFRDIVKSTGPKAWRQYTLTNTEKEVKLTYKPSLAEVLKK